MEFNCPACSAPHAFPEDQIPGEGIVVACTRCGAHITLTRAGVQGAQPLSSAPEPPPPEPLEPEPPAPEPPAPPPADDMTRESRPPSRLPSMPPAPIGSVAGPPTDVDPPPEPALAATAADDGGLLNAAKRAMAAARDSAAGAFDSVAAEAIGPETDVPEGLVFPGFTPNEGSWSWRDLPRAFLGVFDLRRVLFATAGFWAALIIFGLLGWLAGLLGGIWGPLGTIFGVVSWIGFVGAAGIVASILGYVVHQSVVEQRATSVKAGLAWTKEWLKSVVGTPLAFVAVIGAIWAALFVVGLLGRIPFAGPIVWGAVSPITMGLSIAAGAVGVVLFYSLPLYIPVIYNEKTGPIETLKRIAQLFRAHGFRLALYLLLTIITMGFAFVVTVMPMLAIGTRVGMGGALAGYGMENLGQTIAGMPPAMTLGLPEALARGGAGADVAFQYDLAGWLAGIGSGIGPAFVIALVALVYYTAGCIIYSIITGRSKS